MTEKNIYKSGNIQPRDIINEMEESYLNYSMMDFCLGNFFKPSAIAIKSLGLA